MSTEQLRDTLARDLVLEINTGTDETPTWTKVRAITENKLAIDPNTEDSSDYDGDGWTSSTKTAQGWKVEGKVLRKKGVTSGSYDPGQEVIRAAALAFGAENVLHCRLYDREGGPEAYEGYGSATWSPDGGGVTALGSASFTLEGQGALTEIDNPQAT